MMKPSTINQILSKSFIFSLLSLILLLSITGCSHYKAPVSSAKNSTTVDKNTPSKITALSLNSLQSLNSIMPQLATHKAVLVGEIHTSYSDHLNQLAVIKGLHKKWGKIAIGLEMIQQPFQSYLDDYIAGRISEHAMLRGTEYFDRWRFDFRLYRPIFNYAKQNKIPLVALNVPKELTKRITKVGIKGLNKKERSQLPKTLDKSNQAYVKRLKSVFGGHSTTSSKNFEKFFEAQLAWDEGMADQAAKFLQTHSDHRIVILAGGGHIINREGIPDRLERRIKTRPAVVLNNINENPKPTHGDYLLFSPEAKLPSIGRLGIAMKDSKQGVVIGSLLHHGAASKAGLKKVDIIQRLDNTPIKTTTDLRLWALDKKPGDAVTAVIKRKHQSKTFKIVLGKKVPSLKSFHMKSMKGIHGK
ncbi:MAG TPA: PDZ domain-containing protein [Leucothrix mucor]|nr:PDZ domain-containing protein [Leucothrix mucor]